MSLRSLGLGMASAGAAAAAAETHVATLDAIKYVSAVCGAIYALGKLTYVVVSFVREQREAQRKALLVTVRAVVAEEINKRLGKLPCANEQCPTPVPGEVA